MPAEGGRLACCVTQWRTRPAAVAKSRSTYQCHTIAVYYPQADTHNAMSTSVRNLEYLTQEQVDQVILS